MGAAPLPPPTAPPGAPCPAHLQVANEGLLRVGVLLGRRHVWALQRDHVQAHVAQGAVQNLRDRGWVGGCVGAQEAGEGDVQ